MLKHKKENRLYTALLILVAVFSINASKAQEEKPASLAEIQRAVFTKDFGAINDTEILEIRHDALKETAMSYGAISGLTYRNWEIHQLLESKAKQLDYIFNFSGLIIPSHYGTLIEPPIITESDNAFLIGQNSMSASMSSKIYSILENTKIVSTPRDWRNYLMLNMELENNEDLYLALKPQNREEEKIWDQYLKMGWDSGVEQAEEIFEANLNQLTADYIGMIRFKKLLAQKMISAPYAVKEERGTTGNSNEIRIDDNAVYITNIPRLNKKTHQWEPVARDNEK